jgi:adenylyltransferase/sulfurtransferase
MYVSTYEPKDSDWHQHSAFEGCVPVIELPGISSSSSVQALLNCIREHLGPEAVIDLQRNIVERVRCEHCNSEQEVFHLLRAIRHSDLLCPECGKVRDHQLLYAVRGNEPWLERRLSELALPALDVVCAHSGDQIAYFEITADAPEHGFWRGDVGRYYAAAQERSGESNE